MFQAKPKLNQLKKYGNPKSRAVFHEQNIQLFGRQILEVSKSCVQISVHSVYHIINIVAMYDSVSIPKIFFIAVLWNSYIRHLTRCTAVHCSYMD